MPTNDFLGFANDQDANVLSQQAYADSDEKDTGMRSGPASSAMCNKVWRQGANAAAALGRFLVSKGYDALDDGDLATLAKNLSAAVSAVAPYDLTVDYPAGAIVKDSSNAVFVSIAPNGPNSTIADTTNSAYWSPIGSGGGGAGLESYSAAKDYTAGEVVLYAGGMYIALQANGPSSTVAAPSNDTYWAQFVTSNDSKGITDYENSVDYAVGDVIESSGLVYVCTTANGPSTQVVAPTNPTYWTQVITVNEFNAMDFRGVNTYSASVDYTAGAVVEYSGDIYICKQANGPSTAVKAPTVSTYWGKIVTSTATTSAKGLMSAADKKRLNEVAGVFMYSANTDYAYGDIVEYGVGLYGCLQANGPSSTVIAPTDPGASTYWMDIINGYGVAIVAPYDTTFDYVPGAAVTYQNMTYVCKLANGPSTSLKAPTDTTYWQLAMAVMTGATAGAAGKFGLVPTPAAGDQAKFLRGDGTWQTVSGGGGVAVVNAYDATHDYTAGEMCSYSGDVYIATQANGPASVVAAPTNATYWQKVLTSAATSSAAGLMSATDKSKLDGITTMTGAAAGTAGASGLVPAPAAGDQAKFLQGDGTWGTPTAAVMTGATSSTAGTAGSVPAPAAGDEGKFLCANGSWVDIETLYNNANNINY